MKSFYQHLKSVKSVGEDINPNYRPVFKSSAIFQVLHNEHYSKRILFMGYWLLKSN